MGGGRQSIPGEWKAKALRQERARLWGAEGGWAGCDGDPGVRAAHTLLHRASQHKFRNQNFIPRPGQQKFLFVSQHLNTSILILFDIGKYKEENKIDVKSHHPDISRRRFKNYNTLCTR